MMFPLTNAIFWLYSWLTNAKSLDGFSSLLVERILPLCGIFYVRNLFALLSFWVGILGSLRARRSQLRSANPIYPPSPCPTRVAVFSKPF